MENTKDLNLLRIKPVGDLANYDKYILNNTILYYNAFFIYILTCIYCSRLC